jgi:hypothetical protein
MITSKTQMEKRSKVMVKFGIALGFLLLSFGVSNAQNSPVYKTPYNTALGVRIGGTSGITVKNFFRTATAFEGILGVFGNGFSITGLIEKNAQAFDVQGLSWYYGGGAHIAFYNGNRYYNVYGRDITYRDNHDVGIGINGIIGLEYMLPDNIPVAFSLDLKPFIEIDSDGDVAVAPDLALGIKFLIR